MSRYPRFDRSQVELRSVIERGHDIHVEQLASPAAPIEPYSHPELADLVEAIQSARRRSSPVILMLGAHPIKLGLGPFIIDLIRRRIVTHIATNGAGVIHDFELALVGGTSENVAKWISVGQFGLWQETARLNDIICKAATADEGLGEAVGRTIVEQRFPNARFSVCAAGWDAGIPVTCHVTIGGDIIHALPNMDGGCLGRASDTDFLIFANTVRSLEGGVFLNVGTAVTGPEVFLKALSMSRNVARSAGEEIRSFTVAVFDLVTLPENYRDGHPTKEEELYYYRPWKTLLCRTVYGGGHSYYFRGDHRQTIPTLWDRLVHDRA